jgi:hypothetical protein
MNSHGPWLCLETVLPVIVGELTGGQQSGPEALDNAQIHGVVFCNKIKVFRFRARFWGEIIGCSLFSTTRFPVQPDRSGSWGDKRGGGPRSMNMKRVFTEDELKELGRRTLDILCEAIDSGDKEKAKKLSQRMYREFELMHDLYRDWITATLSHIYEDYGDEALYQAMHQGCSSWYRPVVDSYEQAEDFRRRVKMLAMALRGHLQSMKVEEDDEKVCMTMMPCGSGERLFEEGSYGPPKNFSTVKKSQPTTYSKPDCPIYCAHEPMLEILSMEWSGHPVWACFPPEGFATGGCRFCIYKRPEDIPEAVYARVGKEKPSI